MLLPAAVIGLALGALTAYAQGCLPVEVNSLANSNGTWVLAAFLLALPATRARDAASIGPVALAGLVAVGVAVAFVVLYSSNLMLFFS